MAQTDQAAQAHADDNAWAAGLPAALVGVAAIFGEVTWEYAPSWSICESGPVVRAGLGARREVGLRLDDEFRRRPEPRPPARR